MSGKVNVPKHYLLAGDFDRTLSCNDSRVILSELLSKFAFEEKVAGMAPTHLVQQVGAVLLAAARSGVLLCAKGTSDRNWKAYSAQTQHSAADRVSRQKDRGLHVSF